jgi:hypothetical protein
VNELALGGNESNLKLDYDLNRSAYKVVADVHSQRLHVICEYQGSFVHSFVRYLVRCLRTTNSFFLTR